MRAQIGPSQESFVFATSLLRCKILWVGEFLFIDFFYSLAGKGRVEVADSDDMESELSTGAGDGEGEEEDDNKRSAGTERSWEVDSAISFRIQT